MLCGIGKCTLEGDSSDIPQSNCLGHTSRRDFLEDKALQAEGSVVFFGGGERGKDGYKRETYRPEDTTHGRTRAHSGCVSTGRTF